MDGTDEEIARAVAVHNEPELVHRWELPAPARVTEEPDDDTDGERDDGDEIPY